MSPYLAEPVRTDRSLLLLRWLALALFIAYLCIAMALSVVPVFVTAKLGYGNGLAGLAVGIAFASTILTRGLAGRIADARGSRRCMVLGLLAYAAAGLACCGAGWPGCPAPAAYAILLAGRLWTGFAGAMTACTFAPLLALLMVLPVGPFPSPPARGHPSGASSAASGSRAWRLRSRASVPPRSARS